ncbi:MAG TPA: signal peptidase I [Haploplasma sp.]|nr:signal peptidase I [Haploplasma sp.]
MVKMITKKQLVLGTINILLILMVIFFTMFNVSNIVTISRVSIIISGLVGSTILIMINHIKFTKVIKDISEIISFVLITVSIIMIIMTYIVFSSIVKGSSMDPTLKNGQRLYISVFNYQVKIDDVIIYNEKTINDYIVKRVVAKENDVLSTNKVISEDNNLPEYRLMINGIAYQNSNNEYYRLNQNDELYRLISETSYQLEKDEFIALGDNERHSADSRRFGIFNVDKLIGKVIGY